MSQTPEIILDGVSYNINNFSPTVQAMVNVRETWENDLAKEKSSVLKTESAIRALDEQLARIVQDELMAKKKAAEEKQAAAAAEAATKE